ncbi:MAG: 16S rRNA (uracil(1498)-N(3))-methyltransferase [Nitrospirales bacterium]|nr:16S rRNA (uracil(1498)-N(3))-methyltransferase [Nitrospira sp.]MDR4502841.1 16S rRNA (uracil(1498)-N(3))-methyltransferase [Nitrospirales bacterium]
MPVFFISSANIQDQRLTLDGELHSHLVKSLRIRPGEIIQVNDEYARRYMVRVAKVTTRALIGEIIKTLSRPQAEKPTVTLLQSILRGPNMTWIIQKATELGVDKILPVITERVRSRADLPSPAHFLGRWKKIALEASQQSERWVLPEILTPQSFQEMLQYLPSNAQRYILTERQDVRSSISPHLSLGQEFLPSHVILAIGPEGGWTQEELQSARTHGFEGVTLGEKILRSETAALTALVLLKAKFMHIRFLSLTDAPSLSD